MGVARLSPVTIDMYKMMSEKGAVQTYQGAKKMYIRDLYSFVIGIY